MDSLLVEYGVQDLTIFVDDISDATKKVQAGAREMVIAALTDMTRRSRALIVIAPNPPYLNPNSLPYIYKAAGAVSQLDDVSVKQVDGGSWIRSILALGIASDKAESILSLDLRVLRPDDSVLPGAVSSNSVVIVRQGKGLNGEAGYTEKFGINFALTISKSDGQAQALRVLVELGAIELVGKIAKIPYWRCLEDRGGRNVIDPDSNTEIREEISDWYESMKATRVELVAYFQNQMQVRRLYDGPIDGQLNLAFSQAIERYRVALGLPRHSQSDEELSQLDEEFFRSYLGAAHSEIVVPMVDSP